MTNDSVKLPNRSASVARALGIGYWAFFGYWSLVIGHWSLVIRLRTLGYLRRHSLRGGSGNPWARRAVRKCILATLGSFSTPCLERNSLAAASTAAEAPLGN